MTRYFMELSYDGTNYCGWQRQKKSPSVEETITEKLQVLLQNETEIYGCGRTDTGVSAVDYFAHFEADLNMSCEEIVHKLNLMLPRDIAIKQIFPCQLHARFDAIEREYKYYILNHKDPFRFHNWILHHTLNVDIMQDGANLLKEYNDFTSFAKLHSNTTNNLCNIYNAKWEECDECLVFTITANRFLRGMVRAIVGTLVELGRNKISLEEFRRIIEGKNRALASMQAPAKGLFLTRITYPKIKEDSF